jgi:hypothetical protein
MELILFVAVNFMLLAAKVEGPRINVEGCHQLSAEQSCEYNFSILISPIIMGSSLFTT